MWLTLIFAETIAAQSGIGYMAMQAREFMQTDVIVLSILLYALLGKGANSLVKVLERWQLAWRPLCKGRGDDRRQGPFVHDTPDSRPRRRLAANAARRQKGVRRKDGSQRR